MPKYGPGDTLGNRIRTLRKEANLSIEKLSERSDVSFQHLQKIETDNTNPSVVVLKQIADVLHVHPGQLIPDEGPKDDLQVFFRGNHLTKGQQHEVEEFMEYVIARDKARAKRRRQRKDQDSIED